MLCALRRVRSNVRFKKVSKFVSPESVHLEGPDYHSSFKVVNTIVIFGICFFFPLTQKRFSGVTNRTQIICRDSNTYLIFHSLTIGQKPNKNRALCVLSLKLSIRHDAAKNYANIFWRCSGRIASTAILHNVLTGRGH